MNMLIGGANWLLLLAVMCTAAYSAKPANKFVTPPDDRYQGESYDMAGNRAEASNKRPMMTERDLDALSGGNLLPDIVRPAQSSINAPSDSQIAMELERRANSFESTPKYPRIAWIELRPSDPTYGDGLGIRRRIDSLTGTGFGLQKRINSLSGAGFGLQKRINSLSGAGFGLQKRINSMLGAAWAAERKSVDNGGYSKRNFDEIDRSGFSRFFKRNFDEIENSGFNRF